ncbi:hypothetical protein [Methanosphaera cuniculi]|uniref:Uncharacterized protein n=1 Tax=Methanosphaera cuniculi TaxID=1077256 RepID=A0A2A2HFB6_9EURY|nr:hypothetical protein [Methanosphaera cuniculi]PAV08018.1 hypothetical protein ASJ82_05060 [Methanosphaera cuniculi]PWL08749.1 hypothetical protein MSCUN_04630 [Methanosphaera cuniculi]
MLYKYHVVLLKDDVIITDKYYKKDEKPDMDEYQKLKDQTGATEIILNTIDDDPLNSIIKENIDI